VEQSFAKEFTVSGVNQSVRRENFFEARKRFPRREKESAALECDALFLQVVLQSVDCAMSQSPRLTPDSFDEISSLPQ
jgi:hypothetical protein